MHSSHDKTPRALRLTKLVGNGMPERIRAIGFAFLGLTAAAGLGLVAIFAQMGFPVLSPAPLPGGSSGPNSISKAVPLDPSSATIGLAQSQSAAASNLDGGQGGSGPASRQKSGSRDDGSADPASGSVAGNVSRSSQPSEPAGNPAPAPGPTPAPAAPTAETGPAPVETPVASPGTGSKPDRSTPVSGNPDKPKAQPAATKPPRSEAKPSKPAKYPKGVPPKPVKPPKSEPKPDKTAAAPAPAPSYVPAPAPAPEGKDKLQGTEEQSPKGTK